jgi:hypothetical protein
MAEFLPTIHLLTEQGPWLKNGLWAIATYKARPYTLKQANCGLTNTALKAVMKLT